MWFLKCDKSCLWVDYIYSCHLKKNWMLYINITVIFPILIIASDTEIGTQLLADSFFMNRNVLSEGFKVTGIIHNAISWDYSLNHLHSWRSYVAN